MKKKLNEFNEKKSNRRTVSIKNIKLKGRDSKWHFFKKGKTHIY